MEHNSNKKELAFFCGFVSLIVLIFSFALFGVTGARVALGIVFASFSSYLIIGNFELEEGEKFVFSILIGLTTFPSLVYIFGLYFSFRMSIIITFLVFIAAAFVLTKYKPSKNKNEK